MAKTLDIGDTAPDFACASDTGETLTRADYAGRQLVLYFYPRDDTPGCTLEAIDFTARIKEFTAANTAILGVSADTVAKHAKFKAKHGLGITLLSDPDTDMLCAYGVWVEKNMYGRKYMGIERATFLIGTDGKIRDIWRKVKVKGHADAVLEAARA